MPPLYAYFFRLDISFADHARHAAFAAMSRHAMIFAAMLSLMAAITLFFFIMRLLFRYYFAIICHPPLDVFAIFLRYFISSPC